MKKLLLTLFFFFFFANSDLSLSKKMIHVNGEHFKCKTFKNSFERTRGVRNRICIFTKDDKEKINKMRKKKKFKKVKK